MQWIIKQFFLASGLMHKAFAQTTQGTSGGGGITLPNPLGCNDLQCVTGNIIKALQAISIPIVTIMVIWGAFQILTAGGDEEKLRTGRKTITYAAIGFGLVLLASGFSLIIQDLFSH